MKTKEILMIHCLALLGIALISSLFKKVPGIVKNGSFFIAIVLLAVSQVLDETENLELESSSCTDSNQCKGETGIAFTNCCLGDENSCLGAYNKDGRNPICVCCPGDMEISQAWRDHGAGVGPLDPCWKKAMPKKYGPACVPSSLSCPTMNAQEKDFLFTDEELPSGKNNLIENTPRLYGSRKEGGTQTISWNAPENPNLGTTNILQCYGVGCPTENLSGGSCEEKYPPCRTRPWDGTIFSKGEYTCSQYGPSYGNRLDTGDPANPPVTYCPPGTIEGNQYNTSGIGAGYKCGHKNRHKIEASDSLIWDSGSWKKNGTPLPKYNTSVEAADVDNWDVICKTPCCRAQVEYCCQTIPFSYNPDDYNKFKKCLSDRGCATDFTGHPLPETTLKLMWNNCQENY